MIHVYGANIEIDCNLAIAIGKFDGLHKGHVALIEELEKARSLKLDTAVLSFAPHPAAVLTGKNVPQILSSHEKISLLQGMDVDYYIEYPFTHQFAQISPESFIQDILYKQLRCRALVVGENFRFGAGGRGDAVLAKSLGAKLGLQVHTIPLVTDKSVQISAESIRGLVAAKDFDGVAQACGRNFFLMGKVTHGKKKGREMGFPTANIVPYEDKLLPPIGVYHTTTFVGNAGYPSITNVGADVTETHLLDFSGDLYSHMIRVDFLKWMRDGRHFESYDDLAVQLAKDAKARSMQ